MKLVLTFVLALLLLVPANAEAQDKVADGKFWAANIFMVGSTVYDVESSYFVLDRCNCREANPLMKSFIGSGRPTVYAAIAATDVAMMVVIYKIKKRNDKLWWILPVVVTAVHSVAGTNNIRTAIRF